MIGIYCIENLNNNKKYFGQSVNVEKRIKEHKRELKSKNHLKKSIDVNKVIKCSKKSKMPLTLRRDKND